MTRSLVQAADLFLCCAKELESAFQGSNDSSKKILYNLVNRFDRLGALMSIIKSMKHPDSSFHYVQKEKEERIVMANTDDLDRPVIEEDVAEDIFGITGPGGKQATTTTTATTLSLVTPTAKASQGTLSAQEFLDQFEMYARTFAQSANMSIDLVWRALLVHAVPPNRLSWVQNHLINNKHMTWTEARQAYMNQYSDQAKLATPRQERYIGYLLNLKMKDYDTIQSYNQKFYTYSTNANMNLSEPSLFKRYIDSLTPHYRSLMTAMMKDLIIPHPTTLKVVMKRAERLAYEDKRKQAASIYASPPYNTYDEL
ncbi:hypothetical protein RMATCC62417_03611 [Rhizopus microsporus]|nr:hypothetical protein RMATCC62417_03611 [Rhizopus microsporus]